MLNSKQEIKECLDPDFIGAGAREA